MISISAFPKCWLEDIATGKMDLFDWIKTSTILKCDGLELYFGFLQSNSGSYINKVRKAVESLGMEIPMMCYSPDFTIPDKAARANEVEKQKEAIKISAELGVKFCRTLSGQKRPEVNRDTAMEWVIDCISQCLPAAEQAGVKLVIENHYKDGFWEYAEFAQKSEEFLEILSRIESSYLGVQYDPSNAIVAGEDPLELYDKVAKRVMTMHASDRFLSPGSSIDDLKKHEGSMGYANILHHGVTGKGLNNYNEIFKRLKENKFDGWISIEDGMNGMQEMKESVDFLKEMRNKYFGSIEGV